MTKEDLQKFCSRDDVLNTAFNNPFSRGFYTYACNRHILIRIPKLDDVPENPKAPNTDKLWPKKTYKSFIIPSFPEPLFRECEECDGTGKYEGDEICEYCEGEKRFPIVQEIEVGDVYYSDHYLSMIKNMPDIKFYPTTGTTAAYFTFHGGEGLLMPVHHPTYKYRQKLEG